jgi:hypothetical protein
MECSAGRSEQDRLRSAHPKGSDGPPRLSFPWIASGRRAGGRGQVSHERIPTIPWTRWRRHGVGDRARPPPDGPPQWKRWTSNWWDRRCGPTTGRPTRRPPESIRRAGPVPGERRCWRSDTTGGQLVVLERGLKGAGHQFSRSGSWNDRAVARCGAQGEAGRCQPPSDLRYHRRRRAEAGLDLGRSQKLTELGATRGGGGGGVGL